MLWDVKCYGVMGVKYYGVIGCYSVMCYGVMGC